METRGWGGEGREVSWARGGKGQSEGHPLSPLSRCRPATPTQAVCGGRQGERSNPASRLRDVGLASPRAAGQTRGRDRAPAPRPLEPASLSSLLSETLPPPRSLLPVLPQVCSYPCDLSDKHSLNPSSARGPGHTAGCAVVPDRGGKGRAGVRDGRWRCRCPWKMRSAAVR